MAFSQSAIADWVHCSNEGQVCEPPIPAEVRYGANDSYSQEVLTDSIHCHNSVFGDVAPGVFKHCDYQLSNASDFDGDGVVDSEDAFPADETNGQGSRWTLCAEVDGVCQPPVPALVRYGSTGQYLYSESVSSTVCEEAAFVGSLTNNNTQHCDYLLSDTIDFDGDGLVDVDDPYPNDAANNAGGDWVFCSVEGAACSFPVYPVLARYGAGENYVYRTVTEADDFPVCNNSGLGDPAPGVVKHCDYLFSDSSDYDGDSVVDSADPYPNDAENNAEGNWSFCSFEGLNCTPPVSPVLVRYGVFGSYHFAAVSDANGIYCGNSTFGDPFSGLIKGCDYIAASGLDTDGDGVPDNNDAFPTDASETQDSDGDGLGDNSDPFPNDAENKLSDHWVACSSEQQVCEVPIPAVVRYGANDQHLYWEASTPQALTCSNGFFGGDPVNGVLKACEYWLSDVDDYDGDGLVDRDDP